MSAPGFDILSHVAWADASSETIVKKFKGRARQWSGENLKNVRALLRKELLEEQGNRCAYCRRIIYAELGKHEVDHIAPCSIYPEFTYTRINLVATCKRCNWHKREYDTLSRENGARRTLYPTVGSAWNWVHPYFHSYDQHIRIIDGFIFTPSVGSSKQTLARAQNLIENCGLSTLKTVESLAMLAAATADKEDWTAALRVIGQYPEASALSIAKILKDARKLPSPVEAISEAILEIRKPHGQLEAFYRKVLSRKG